MNPVEIQPYGSKALRFYAGSKAFRPYIYSSHDDDDEDGVGVGGEEGLEM